MKRPASIKKVSLVLLLLVLLPALFYSVYEINSLSTSERLIGDIYQQQLDAILFSLNQYAFEVVNDWASRSTILLNESASRGRGSSGEVLSGFLERNPPLQAVFTADTAFKSIEVFPRHATSDVPALALAYVRQLLNRNREKFNRLVRLGEVEYRKIEPLVADDSSGAGGRLSLAFLSGNPAGSPRVTGFIIDENLFITNMLGPKIRETAGEQFVIAVVAKDRKEPILATEPIASAGLKQQRRLWLFPDLSLGIRLRGATVEEYVRSRFYGNLVLILLLDVVLLAGAWVVYRSIRREMELVRLKSDFVSNVSHELRTPLSLIRMFAETLEMGRIKDGPKRQEYYSTIVQEAERLTRLVNNILSFSRMEAGKKQYTMGRVDLNAVVSDVLKTYGFHMQSQGFAPVVSLDRNLPDITADSEALSEALINIIDNAMKYSEKEKFLSVRTGAENGMVCVEVEDHGVGIPGEFHTKIFETFYRVESTASQKASGSGLGLALVRHIMDAHGGTVTVDSEPGRGSRFRLQFPVPTQKDPYRSGPEKDNVN